MNSESNNKTEFELEIHGGDQMSEEMKRDIKETVDILKSLDKQSLLLVQAGAQMLKARQDMDRKEAHRDAP